MSEVSASAELLESLGGTTTEVEELPAADVSTNLGIPNSIEERALNLLGSGVQAESVANALGVTSGRISQLLAEENFALRVASLRYESLQKHTIRDNKYDSLEDQLLDKLQRNLSLIIRPETLLKAIAVVNSAKRRGQSAPEQSVNKTMIVNLLLPTKIIQHFSTNIDNQVIKAGSQELVTIPSSTLLKQTKELQEERLIEDSYNHAEQEQEQ